MYTIAMPQHSESHILRKRSIIGDVGLAPSCSSLLELQERLGLNTDSWWSLTLLHVAGKDRGKSLTDEECRKWRKWSVCLLKGADEGKVAYNSIRGKVWRW
jgi:hypothetical protein